MVTNLKNIWPWVDTWRSKNFKNKPNKIPHVGWNNLNIMKKHKILNNLDGKDNLYFVHSYKFNAKSKQNKLCTTNYNEDFAV